MGVKGKSKEDVSHPLPKVSYSTLKDKAIKSLLVESRLPTIGDKNAWVARHKRFASLFPFFWLIELIWL
jgi:hypothetical protein